jgi:hypothetical protein
LDDAVMGGASSSGITYDPEAKAIVFGGELGRGRAAAGAQNTTRGGRGPLI